MLLLKWINNDKLDSLFQDGEITVFAFQKLAYEKLEVQESFIVIGFLFAVLFFVLGVFYATVFA